MGRRAGIQTPWRSLGREEGWKFLSENQEIEKTGTRIDINDKDKAKKTKIRKLTRGGVQLYKDLRLVKQAS